MTIMIMEFLMTTILLLTLTRMMMMMMMMMMITQITLMTRKRVIAIINNENGNSDYEIAYDDDNVHHVDNIDKMIQGIMMTIKIE